MDATPYPGDVDVAIVGSGPAGSTYARILSERAPGARIAMFEVGPIVSDPPGAHVKNIADPVQRQRAQQASQGPRAGGRTVDHPGAVKAGERVARPGTYLLDDGFAVGDGQGMPVVAFSSNVGGMGAHWTAACPRPGGRERVGWVAGLDELLDEGERLLGVTTDEFERAPFTRYVRERLAEAIDEGRSESARVQRMPLAVGRSDDGGLFWSGADVVMGEETRSNPNFALFPNSLVRRIIVEDGRAVGIEVEHQGSREQSTVRARVVVVAADALRTPQLLWASGVRPEALGRWLNDQSQIVYAARIRGTSSAGLAEVGDSLAAQVDAGVPVKLGAISEQSGVSWIPYTDEEPFHGQVMQLDTSPIPLAEDDPAEPGSIVGLGLFVAKTLDWGDRVTFSADQLDDYGMPAMRIHYQLTDRDRELIERAKQRIARLAEAVGEPLGDTPFLLPAGASLHYQGTTSMGAVDDGRSVCGPESELWAVSGLYVAGNGVIPTATACNPTLTAVALAVRGARSIAEKLTNSLLM